jgi:hypothetical protein
VKPKIGHLRIFGCLVYIHVPLEKRTKLEHSGQKGIFVGCRETSKTYRIFIPMQRKIVVSRDVNFQEKLDSRSTQESSTMTEDKEQQSPKDEQQSTVHTSGGEEELAPSSPVRRPRWLVKTLRYVGEAPRSVVRDHRPLKKFPNYMVLMSGIIDVEPSNFE